MRPRHPDLQRLVEHFGGFDKIPPETWQAYDEACAGWRKAYLDEILDMRAYRPPSEKRRAANYR